MNLDPDIIAQILIESQMWSACSVVLWVCSEIGIRACIVASVQSTVLLLDSCALSVISYGAVYLYRHIFSKSNSSLVGWYQCFGEHTASSVLKMEAGCSLNMLEQPTRRLHSVRTQQTRPHTAVAPACHPHSSG